MDWNVNGPFIRYTSSIRAIFFSHSRGVVVPVREPVDDQVVARAVARSNGSMVTRSTS